MIKTTKLLLPSAILGLAASTALGQSNVLAQWTFASDMSATSSASDVTASDVDRTASTTEGPLSSGGGIIPDGTSYTDGNAINDDDWTEDGGGRAYGRLFQNIDDHYFSFDITMDAGVTYQLQDVTFDAGFRSGGPSEMRVQYSLNSDFSDPVTIGHAAGFLDSPQTGLGYGAENPADDGIEGLPSLGVIRPGVANFSWNRFENDGANAALSGTVYFRVQAAGATSGSGAGNFYLDNLTVTAVPEPSTYAALFGMVGLAMVAWRRRRA